MRSGGGAGRLVLKESGSQAALPVWRSGDEGRFGFARLR